MAANESTTQISVLGEVICPSCEQRHFPSTTRKSLDQLLVRCSCHCNLILPPIYRNEQWQKRCMLINCRECKEREYAARPVPGIGPITAKIVVIGRNPGRSEDIQGKPFVGPSGIKAEQGFQIAHLNHEDLYITNLSKCYTPAKIIPTKSCQHVCSTLWLREELKALAQLQLIITFGNEALRYFMTEARISELHGLMTKLKLPTSDRVLSIFPSYHPSAALRSISRNRQYLDDMETLASLWPDICNNQ